MRTFLTKAVSRASQGMTLAHPLTGEEEQTRRAVRESRARYASLVATYKREYEATLKPNILQSERRIYDPAAGVVTTAERSSAWSEERALDRRGSWYVGTMFGSVFTGCGGIMFAATAPDGMNAVLTYGIGALVTVGSATVGGMTGRKALVGSRRKAELLPIIYPPEVQVDQSFGKAYVEFMAVPDKLRELEVSPHVLGQVDELTAAVLQLGTEANRLWAAGVAESPQADAVRSKMFDMAAHARALVVLAQEEKKARIALATHDPHLIASLPNTGLLADAAEIVAASTAAVEARLGSVRTA